MNIALIIAGGKGVRMNQEIPKQFLNVNDKPVIAYTMEAFEKHGICFDEVLDYESVRFSFEEGYRAARNLLARGREFTAIFAMSDVMAIGAIRALRDAGLRVPEDVSVMGFDGLAVGEYTVPTLSTIRQSVDAMAQRSVDILLENIGQAQPARHETVPFFVELRESTKKN